MKNASCCKDICQGLDAMFLCREVKVSPLELDITSVLLLCVTQVKVCDSGKVNDLRESSQVTRS